jgi:hypothetical protein
MATPASAPAQILRVRAVLVPHDKDVPEKSFVADLKRKLRLRKVMKHSEVEREPLDHIPPAGSKFGKEDSEVNYRYASIPEKSCGECQHFLEPGSCEIVAGLIRRVDTCNKFHPEDPGVVRAKLVSATEVTPPGYEKIVKALKKEPGIQSPWAIAWSMKKKGITPKTAVRASLVAR